MVESYQLPHHLRNTAWRELPPKPPANKMFIHVSVCVCVSVLDQRRPFVSTMFVSISMPLFSRLRSHRRKHFFVSVFFFLPRRSQFLRVASAFFAQQRWVDAAHGGGGGGLMLWYIYYIYIYTSMSGVCVLISGVIVVALQSLLHSNAYCILVLCHYCYCCCCCCVGCLRYPWLFLLFTFFMAAPGSGR